VTFEEFSAVVSAQTAPPENLPELLKALLYDARGDWDHAHRIAQQVETPDGCWVHAYLHRKEGDRGNAQYWYRQAGLEESRSPLPEEWEAIARHLLP
jgi:hypothetical protein